MTVKQLRNELKGKGIKGIWKMRKADLEKALLELNKPNFDDIIDFEVTDSKKVEDTLKGNGREVLKASSKEEWEIIREGGIGGSDVASLVGYNKYNSKIDIFISKTHRNNEVLSQQYQEKQQKIKETEAVKMGHILEPVIADMFQNKHKEFKVVDVPITVKKEDWEVANVDRYLIDEKGNIGILEVKTTSLYNLEEWEGETVPDNYFIQCQWYMYVTGLKFAYISCLVGGQHYKEFKIERNEDTINYLREEAEIFWNDHVIMNEVPEPDGTTSYTEYLQQKAEWREAKGEKIEIEGIERQSEWDDLQEQKKEIEYRLNEIKNQVMNQAVERSSKKGTWGEKKFSILGGGTSRRFETIKFKKEYPDLYEEFSKESKKACYITIK